MFRSPKHCTKNIFLPYGRFRAIFMLKLFSQLFVKLSATFHNQIYGLPDYIFKTVLSIYTVPTLSLSSVSFLLKSNNKNITNNDTNGLSCCATSIGGSTTFVLLLTVSNVCSKYRGDGSSYKIFVE